MKPQTTAGGPSVSPAQTEATSRGEGDSGLMEQVVARENMLAALKRVRQNGGAPGVDGMTADALRGYLSQHWPAIREELLTKDYKSKPVRRVEIPKPDGGVRLLGIPTVLDRLIQQALLQVLTPVFDPGFSESSYGFRPGRKAEDAVKAAQRHIDDGYLSWLTRSAELVPTLSAQLAISDIYSKKGLHSDAAMWQARACLKEPENVNYRVRLAHLLADAKDYGRAIAQYQGLPAEARQFLWVLLPYASCHMSLGQYAEALAILEGGPRLKQHMDDSMMEYRYLLGVCYQTLNEVKKAGRQFRRVYSRNPNYRDTASRLRELGEMPAVE